MSEASIEELVSRRLVWHYTTLESLQIILKTGTLLATEVSYQNDPREPDTANEAVRESLRELGTDPTYKAFSREALRWHLEWHDHNGFIRGGVGGLIGNSRFIFCASTDPDNLYAWRTYAAGSRTGCAIGIDPEAPLGTIGDTADDGSVGFRPWSEVIYEPHRLRQFSVEKLRAVADLWNREMRRLHEWIEAQHSGEAPERLEADTSPAFRYLLTDFAEAVADITAVAKHASFRDERETRVTLSDAAFAVVFSPGIDGPRPRVRLASSERWGQVMERPAGRLPIRAIVLAPNAKREARKTTEWLLYANNYPLDPEDSIDESGPVPVLRFDPKTAVGIFRSAHPYRDV
jgi:hypothetical protein